MENYLLNEFAFCSVNYQDHPLYVIRDLGLINTLPYE